MDASQAILNEGLFVQGKGWSKCLMLQSGVLSTRGLYIEATHKTDGTVLLEAGVGHDHLLHLLLEKGGFALHLTNDVFLEQILDVLVSTGHGYRVSLVGTAITQGLVGKEVDNLLRRSRHTERNTGTGDTLGSRDDVRNDTLIMLKAKQLARTSKAHHNLVTNHHNVVLGTHSADSLHVTWRHDQDSTGSDDALHEDASNGIRSFVQNLFLEHVEGLLHPFGLVITSVFKK
mmetsp:Transcript_23558/g.35348  ORF Transcript_23558/g.35348 Transcript_23558/m.35348 type:complete len:231 (+) Transcript_23558:259-951(+)